MLKRLLVLIFGIGLPLLLIIAAFVGYQFVFDSNVNLEKNEVFELFVLDEDNPRDVLNKLVDAKIIKNQRSFILVAQQKKWLTAKTGRYVIKSGMSNNDLINMFRSGLQTPVRLTINQVENMAHVAGMCAAQLMIDSAAIYGALSNSPLIWQKNLTSENMHSLIIPNTYEIYWNVSPEKFAARLMDEYNTFWTEDRLEKAEKQHLNQLQVSTLASIVEKETAQKDEMPVVARLYLNRLKKGMLLQSDPTVIYAKKQRDGDTIEIRRVLYADLEIDSPYNTYKYQGLPPAPITIPSIFAIDAVLNPADNEYIYMCADPERPGYHSFARTDAQHAINKQKWVKWLNDNEIMR